MEMNLKYPLKNYEAIEMVLQSYLEYPTDEVGREQYFSNRMLNFIYERNSNDLSRIFAEHSNSMAKLSLSDRAYKPPRNGYKFHHAYIAAQCLLAMIRMKVSGIEPSLLKAQFFYEQYIQQGMSKKVEDRTVKTAWTEYRSVAHLALVGGVFGECTPQKYPHFLATLYVVQKKYLEIIKDNKYQDFDIWEIPPLNKLYWNREQITPPKEFLEKYNSFITFEPFNEKELEIFKIYSKG
ncbi:hypothetical protein ACUIJ1_06190 [Acinetobacter junii]|uniref:hypothetical protein n=1 Tax=Acinetobacter junii TaxID=40215 RepID=UPI00403E332E